MALCLEAAALALGPAASSVLKRDTSTSSSGGVGCFCRSLPEWLAPPATPGVTVEGGDGGGPPSSPPKGTHTRVRTATGAEPGGVASKMNSTGLSGPDADAVTDPPWNGYSTSVSSPWSWTSTVPPLTRRTTPGLNTGERHASVSFSPTPPSTGLLTRRARTLWFFMPLARASARPSARRASLCCELRRAAGSAECSLAVSVDEERTEFEDPSDCWDRLHGSPRLGGLLPRGGVAASDRFLAGKEEGDTEDRGRSRGKKEDKADCRNVPSPAAPGRKNSFMTAGAEVRTGRAAAELHFADRKQSGPLD
ncbi:hypothetical protein EYF80_008169 [Liparis tanakae]|uniref:Uncharacterized protein n=1 Tax=Liparis tanakae TaxID=230148 RepID=A0A4Z2IWT3_9TELE|nr:hypothetical protein EYF80_008169 [Liparis tanakae]